MVHRDEDGETINTIQEFKDALLLLSCRIRLEYLVRMCAQCLQFKPKNRPSVEAVREGSGVFCASGTSSVGSIVDPPPWIL